MSSSCQTSITPSYKSDFIETVCTLEKILHLPAFHANKGGCVLKFWPMTWWCKFGARLLESTLRKRLTCLVGTLFLSSGTRMWYLELQWPSVTTSLLRGSQASGKVAKQKYRSLQVIMKSPYLPQNIYLSMEWTFFTREKDKLPFCKVF